jgi:PD-(D/E)XK endonuclease
MTTNQKGAIAETAVAHAATKLGIDVYRAVAEGGRYDLIFVIDEVLLRVQCKWAARRGSVLDIPCVSCWRGGDGYVRRTYTRTEVDGIAAYSLDLDRCYYVPIDRVEGRPVIRLRIVPTRDNQRRGINWAKDFEFAATIAC